MVMLLNIFSGTYNVILRGTPWYFETKMKVIRNTPNACRLISIFVWCHFLCSIVLSLMLYSSCKQLARIYLMRASFVVRQGRINYCTSLSNSVRWPFRLHTVSLLRMRDTNYDTLRCYAMKVYFPFQKFIIYIYFFFFYWKQHFSKNLFFKKRHLLIYKKNSRLKKNKNIFSRLAMF